MTREEAEVIVERVAREVIERVVTEMVPQLVADAVQREIEAIKAEAVASESVE